MNINKIVVGLVRSSGISEDKLTLERQELQIREYATKHALAEPTILLDHAKSGFKANRKGLIKLVELCESGNVSHVIFCDISRLARNVELALRLISLFNSKGITFISLTEQIDSSTSAGKFYLNILLSLAQHYRDNISDRMKALVQHKKKHGLRHASRYIAYGMMETSENKLVPNEQEQAVIAEMLDLHVNAKFSFQAIANSLNRRKIPTRANKKWTASTVQKIINRSLSSRNTNAA